MTKRATARLRRSAGLLLFRRAAPGRETDGLEVLLGHMGGPFFAGREAGAWTIPKGEYPDGRDRPGTRPAASSGRNWGWRRPTGEAVPLGEVRQAGGKVVTAWAVEADLDPAAVVPGTFRMEWPRGSGQEREFPELDRVRWFGLDAARAVIVKAQGGFLDRLTEHSER